MSSTGSYTRTVAERIRTARMAAALTQDELADMLYVDRSTVSKWERAQCKIGVDELMAVADALGMSVDELIGSPRGKSSDAGKLDIMPFVRQAVSEYAESHLQPSHGEGACDAVDRIEARWHRERRGFPSQWDGRDGQARQADGDLPERAAALWARISGVFEDAGIYGAHGVESQCGASHVRFSFYVDSDTRARFSGGLRGVGELEDYIERVSEVPKLLIEPPSPYDGHMTVEASMPEDLLLPVTFSNLQEFVAGHDHPSPVSTCAGMGPDGAMEAIVLSDGPHWLICGQTGSGKTVAMHSMILGCMMHSDPSELRVTWIDPKKVEAQPYAGSPFCPIDPVYDLGDAYGVFAYFVWQMHYRYEQFRKVHARNVSEYNDWAARNADEAKGRGMPGKLPYWILAIDEYADLSQTGGHELEVLVKSIGAMGRAAGLILMVSTQRPSAESISSTLKSNIPARIALRVTSAINSDIILDHDGAEKLRGKGDAIVRFGDSSDEVRVQFPSVTKSDLDEQLRSLKERYSGAYANGEYFTDFEKEHLVDPLTSRRSKWYGRSVDEYEHSEDGELLYTREGKPVVRKDPDNPGAEFGERWHETPYDELVRGHETAKSAAESEPNLQIDFKTIVVDADLARHVHMKRVLCEWASDASPDLIPDGSWADDWHVVPCRNRLGLF